MKIVLQRVSHGNVVVDGKRVGVIDTGLVLLVGFGAEDTEAQLAPMAKKVANLRVFSNDEGRFDYSVNDVGGGVLAVPQFTLYADTRKGRRPEFFSALHPDKASPLFDAFVEELRQEVDGPVATGVFGADMKVSLLNDGPVTITLES